MRLDEITNSVRSEAWDDICINYMVAMGIKIATNDAEKIFDKVESYTAYYGPKQFKDFNVQYMGSIAKKEFKDALQSLFQQYMPKIKPDLAK